MSELLIMLGKPSVDPGEVTLPLTVTNELSEGRYIAEMVQMEEWSEERQRCEIQGTVEML